ncbi:MAG: hypothetical protein AAGA30_02665 [Planctomycetota bacterium]
MTNTKNKPLEVIRDGSTKAVIWANESKNGMRYSIEFARSYKDANDQWQDCGYFSNEEILKVQRLAGLAYNRINEIRSKS